MQVHSNWAATSEDARFKADMQAFAMKGETTNYAIERASELLFKVQDETTGLILNAEILRALTRESQSNMEGHLAYLQEIRARINAIWDRTFDLHRISANTLAWQRDTIAELTTRGAQVAASTQAAIDSLSETGESPFKPEYRRHVSMLADASQKIRETMTMFFDRYMMQQKSRRQAALVLATE